MKMSLLLLLLGALIIAGLGLLIYSIVAKRYWLTAILLLLPLGLIVLLIPYQTVEVANTSASAHERQIGYRSQQGGFAGDIGHSEIVQGNSGNHGHAEATGVHDVAADIGHSEIAQSNSGDHSHAEATDGHHDHSSKYEYSPSEPLTADIYPNLALCGRPLAFQLANDIRNSHQFSPKTAFTFKIIRKPPYENLPSGDIHWQPTDNFKSAFAGELLKQFPQSKFVVAEGATTEVGAEATNRNFIKLDIKLSHATSKADRSSGLVQANWIINGKNKGKASVNYVEKRWVNAIISQARDPNHFGVAYRPSYNAGATNQVIGFTNRFARSPEEASNLAMQNAVYFYRRSNNSFSYKVTDRFTQKLTLPYGELWQEAVLVAFDAKHGAEVAHSSARNISFMERYPKGIVLLFLTVGAFSVAWISNLLTQGYYRQTINYTLVTAIAVIVGLIILMMSLGSFGGTEIAALAGLLVLILVLKYFS